MPGFAEAASEAPKAARSASVSARAAQTNGIPRNTLNSREPAGSLPPSERSGVVPSAVIVGMGPGVTVTGRLVAGTRVASRLPVTSDTAVNAALEKAGARSIDPLFPGALTASLRALDRTTTAQLGPGAANLSSTYILHVKDQNSTSVAKALAKVPGIAYAEPDVYVNTMDTGGQRLPDSVLEATPSRSSDGLSTAAPGTPAAPSADPSIPRNFAVADSAQALLNAGGVDALGAYSILAKDYGQLPGAGEIITNVSVGDLTDESMINQHYVRITGPTTVLSNGQRYLDLPSMPLIPTYVADPGGGLNPTESVENEDPSLGEVMLDFGVMSPLPHNLQRPSETGKDYTDLLGIAPGAAYRLVVPQQPTYDEIARALMSAAQQSPRPNVITASLGFGTDAVGMPGRYLEDDPLINAVVAAIVHQYGIIVSISSNDGTRLFTPTAVGPDGGSTPTNLARNAASATNIGDDAGSTTPSQVPDSGAIAAGGTTLDDTLSAGTAGPATTAETRISGFGVFASGFGSRVDLSAPSDNVLAFVHPLGGGADSVGVTLNGGTSASAPEIAAAAAVVLQASRLAGHHLNPTQVRSLLERTARVVPTPAQIDQSLNVGPQIDVTAAVEAALAHRAQPGRVEISRLSVAHHVTLGNLGGEFIETTDPDYLDLGNVASGGDGEGLVGPVTIAGDVVGLPDDRTRVQYTLTEGSKVWRSQNPAIRVTPRQLLAAAGLPVVSTTDRNVSLVYRVLINGRVAAAQTHTLTIGPSDGHYAEASAPTAPATAAAGHAVTVRYDLTGVAGVVSPELVVSTAGRWNPRLAPIFSAAWSTLLKPDTAGTVTIPASAFDDGSAIYGIGVLQAPQTGVPPVDYIYGEFAPIRIVGAAAANRPAAPVLTGEGVTGHSESIDRAQPTFSLGYDVREVPGAASTLVEISAPAPTVYNSFNTYTNANGTRLDSDGVDTASTGHFGLPGTTGTSKLNGLTLGLATSETYDVRVFAVDHKGRIVGQASPISTLEFDDGLTPNGARVLSFAAAGAQSVAALRESDGSTQVEHYNTATGLYGPLITSDPKSGSDYEVLGVDAARKRALLVHQSSSTGVTTLETWNIATDTLAGNYTVPAGYTYASGEVDAARGRAALLLRPLSATTGLNDSVAAIDLVNGAASALLDADPAGVPADTYSLMTIDQATGKVFLTTQSTLAECLGGVMPAQVDLDSGAVTSLGEFPRCLDGLASVDGTLYGVAATLRSVLIVPTSQLVSADESTGAVGTALPIRRQGPIGLAADRTRNLAVIMYAMAEGTPYFGQQQGFVPDSNATGQLALVSLKTGQTLNVLSGFQGATRGGPLMHGALSQLLQLDPSTRTGWAYANGDQQIQQFSY